MFSQQQLERAQREDICPAIQLEDPHCAIMFPVDLPASDDSVFLLHFDNDKPNGFTTKADTMRLKYVKVCDQAYCWQLSVKTTKGEVFALLKSDPTSAWPVNWHGGSGVEQYWTMDDRKLDHVRFSQHPMGGTKGRPASVDDIMVHLSRTESRQDALMRRSEALVHRASQTMVAKMDGVTDVLTHIAENAQQTALRIHEVERQQRSTNEIIADLQRQVSELQERASPTDPEPRQSTAAPTTPDGPVPSTSVKIDGHEVCIDELKSPMPVRWWQGKRRYADVWLPPQRAVFDVDRHEYTVDLQSRWQAQGAVHCATSVRYLSFCKKQSKNGQGDRRKRQRRW